MYWTQFIYIVVATLAIGSAGALVALRHKSFSVWACALTGLAACILGTFIAGLWVSLGRPPLRTMGETRLWYSFFMLVSGLWVYRHEGHRWMPGLSLIVSAVFMIVCLAHPEMHDQSLPPVLQSGWFVPHVSAYIFAYSLMGCAFLLALRALWKVHHSKAVSRDALTSCDNLVQWGFLFLTFGLLSGCLWAVGSWGTYWSWDPKETWAAATWASYIVYFHIRLHKSASSGVAALWLLIGFILLQMCWYGFNYLPSAARSLHSY